MHLVVHFGHSLAQWLDASRGTVLASSQGDVERSRAREAALNLVLDLGSTLAQIGPLVRLLEIAKFAGTLRAPNHTSRRARGVEAGVRQVAFVRIAEILVDLGLRL